MNNDLVTSFHNKESLVNSLVFVFNYPCGFNHLAQMKEIDASRWMVKSEVVFVVSKPIITQNKEIDCGVIIKPHADNVECMKYWAEVHLHKTWQDVVGDIVQIQTLQLKRYQSEIQLIKDKYTCDGGTAILFAHQVYVLVDKINRIKRATSLLNNVIMDSVQRTH
jgi:hypothetical protein